MNYVNLGTEARDGTRALQTKRRTESSYGRKTFGRVAGIPMSYSCKPFVLV
jgi:hypothetical protein